MFLNLFTISHRRHKTILKAKVNQKLIILSLKKIRIKTLEVSDKCRVKNFLKKIKSVFFVNKKSI